MHGRSTCISLMSLISTDPLYEQILHLFRRILTMSPKKIFLPLSIFDVSCNVDDNALKFAVYVLSMDYKNVSKRNYYQFGTLRYLWWHYQLNLFSGSPPDKTHEAIVGKIPNIRFRLYLNGLMKHETSIIEPRTRCNRFLFNNFVLNIIR